MLHFEDSWGSAGVWLLLLFVDSALCCGQCTVLWTVHCAVDSVMCCGQCFDTFWKRVIIREVGHCLSYILIKKFSSCASTSHISHHDMDRDSFNTIEIGIVTN